MNVSVRDARPGDEPAVIGLVRAVLVEYGMSPDRGGLDADIEDLTANFIARGGAFRVLTDETGAIVGCGGLYPVDAETVEIRKMYFVPALRGRGLGRTLLNELIERARTLGFRRAVLQTASVLIEAQALYRSAGFTEVPPSHAVTACDTGFELRLSDEGRRS